MAPRKVLKGNSSLPKIEDAGGVWFKVEGLVARGERSIVRRATVTGSNDKIVIKILPSICDEKGTVLPREVLAMRLCEHPSVLSVKKVFYDMSQTFICMVLWSGGNVLDRILENGGIAEEDAVIVIQDVLEGLDHIHSRGLIHSAIEPSNIYLISGDPCSPEYHHAVIGGLQRVKTEVLNAEDRVGDLNYVSPELVDNFSKTTGIGPETDMWSLGATLFTMLSGSLPFSQKSNATLSDVIKTGEVQFVSPFWDMTSRLAKDFISQLLVVKWRDRMTSKQCRKHAWMEAALEINRRTTPHVLRAELTLRKMLIFKDIDDECLHDLARRLQFVKFASGVWVAKSGKDANAIYFVHSGSVSAYVEGSEVDTVMQGGFFGEAAYMTTRRHICDFLSNGQRFVFGKKES